MDQEELTPRRSSRKRKSISDIADINIGTKFVKRFSNGVDSACYVGLVVQKSDDYVTVVYEDNDKETIDVREVVNWRRMDLTSTMSNEKVSTLEMASASAASSSAAPASPSPKKGEAGSTPADDAAATTTRSAELQLTLLGGMVAQTVTDVYMPAAIAAGGFGHLLSGSEAAWFPVAMALFLNVSGALMDGAAAVVEERGPKAAAAVASCARGGFLSAYTSFTQMAVHAGEGNHWLAAVRHIAYSVGAGAVAFVVGRRIAELLLSLWDEKTKKEKQEATTTTTTTKAKAEQDKVDGVLFAARVGCAAVLVLSLLYAASTNALQELLVGLPLTAAGVFVGNALGTTVAANGVMAATISFARIAGTGKTAVFGSGESGIAARFLGAPLRALVFNQFCGSFCGSGSAFCGTAGDAVTEWRGKEEEGGGGGEGGDPAAAVFGLATDVTSALFIAAVAAATVEGGASPDEDGFGTAKAAAVASCVAAALGYYSARRAGASQKEKRD